ncbi:DUF4926 domain-containing protein [Alteromonas sp. 07-89-2]|jgi:hypothetical protein|uniref:DUF4926 domain-containing protein n=1 Tax=Alteromonas sp. 07-89-2 TaxID=2607609 RepID=UPI00148D52B6|nr:DUF4926 domain-containing protein [Alteromonas sp. 07-89-2]MDK2763739.1 DUF4926 domain-containing protein [Alteromonas macleodii]MEC9431085.1 DUF4926 domain-containing protein [Pseudomonadota bacterium]NOH57981.1 DUF4926 domain-containing protein [Alteromonas sp. 07-89-2]|tara:strand:+ start:522 stop:710 length:189 start_codon:yes stop_codon:yes gene_type:complete
MLYKKVVLKASEFKDEGLPEGVVGYVIDDFGDGNYDVEFSNENGETIDILVLNSNQFELVDG